MRNCRRVFRVISSTLFGWTRCIKTSKLEESLTVNRLSHIFISDTLVFYSYLHLMGLKGRRYVCLVYILYIKTYFSPPVNIYLSGRHQFRSWTLAFGRIERVIATQRVVEASEDAERLFVLPCVTECSRTVNAWNLKLQTHQHLSSCRVRSSGGSRAALACWRLYEVWRQLCKTKRVLSSRRRRRHHLSPESLGGGWLRA